MKKESAIYRDLSAVFSFVAIALIAWLLFSLAWWAGTLWIALVFIVLAGVASTQAEQARQREEDALKAPIDE